MIIQVYQAGGFAGSDPIPLGRVDTSELSPDDQTRVQKLARDIANAPEGSVPIGADLVEYRIHIHPDAGPARTIVIPDDMNPQNPLLRSVQDLLAFIGRSS